MSEEADAPHPRNTQILAGHSDAERVLLDAYRSGRMPHAWLIGGPAGIGKATLAYRLARFALAHPDPHAPEVIAATSLAVDPQSSAARMMTARALPGLSTLEREANDRGTLRTVITIEQVRKMQAMFGGTADGWRICVVDKIDDMGGEATNALLKMLEEPPPRSLFLLVSDAPGRLLATIRSRCRKLILRPLSDSDVATATAQALQLPADDDHLRKASAQAQGSVARAVLLMGGALLSLHDRTQQILAQLPHVDQAGLHALGDALAADREGMDVFTDAVNGWLAGEIDRRAREPAALARISEVWEKFNNSARDADIYNLERKPFVFTTFGYLGHLLP